MSKPRAVLGTVSSDAHGWNLVYLEMVLSESGYEVCNLGPCSSVRDVMEAVNEAATALVVLSSVNGHGCIEAPSYAGALRNNGRTRSVPLVLGGQLTSNGTVSDDQLSRLCAAGFDRVFTGADAIAELRAYLVSLRSLTHAA
jgi:methylaspartate mutase sigma subunit